MNVGRKQRWIMIDWLPLIFAFVLSGAFLITFVVGFFAGLSLAKRAYDGRPVNPLQKNDSISLYDLMQEQDYDGTGNTYKNPFAGAEA